MQKLLLNEAMAKGAGGKPVKIMVRARLISALELPSLKALGFTIRLTKLSADNHGSAADRWRAR